MSSNAADHQILIPPARQKIQNNFSNGNNNNNQERSNINNNNNNNRQLNNNNNNNNGFVHKKSQSTPPQQISSMNNTTNSNVHSQPIMINSSSLSKNNNFRKNKNNQSSGSYKKNNDQSSREVDQLQQQPQFNNTTSSPIDDNTRSRAKSFQSAQFTPKQALTTNTKPNKQLLNVSNHVQSKSIPNSPVETFEVSKSTLINGSNNNNSSPTKYVKIMTPPAQRKKKQLVEENYSSSAPSKISLKFDDNDEENERVLNEVVDDLITKFVLNVPFEDQMEGIDSRLCETLFFQLEEAFWFYYDFERVKHKALPKYKFSVFCEKVFSRCPSLLDELTQNDPSNVDVDSLVQRFLDYKTSIPVYGCIILNDALDKVLLVQGYNTKSWSFPKGKINQNERESTCAAREVYEECGYELGDKVSEQDFIEIEQNYENSVPDYKDKYKHSNPYTKLFIVGGIPESTNFVTRTRKEILKIKWFSIDYLYETCYPRNKEKQGLRTWLVKPFLNSLIDWIKKKKQVTNPKTPDRKPVNRSNRSLTAPAVPNLSVSTIITHNNQTNVGSPLLSFVFDTEEILKKK